MSSRSAYVFFVASLCGATLLGGCVANDISIVITEFVDPDPSLAASGDCEYDQASLTAPVTIGTYDIALANMLKVGYNVSFAVKNQLEEIQSEPIETQAYYINSFDVELIPNGPIETTFSDPSAPKKLYNYPVGSQYIPPGMTALFSMEVLSAEFAADLQKLATQTVPSSITVRVRPVSTRAEEQQVGAFSTFPIDFCFGCLTGTASSGGTKIPDCPPPSTTPQVGNICNPASDASITCCMCGTELLCGSDTATATTCGTSTGT